MFVKLLVRQPPGLPDLYLYARVYYAGSVNSRVMSNDVTETICKTNVDHNTKVALTPSRRLEAKKKTREQQHRHRDGQSSILFLTVFSRGNFSYFLRNCVSANSMYCQPHYASCHSLCMSL